MPPARKARLNPLHEQLTADRSSLGGSKKHRQKYADRQTKRSNADQVCFAKLC